MLACILGKSGEIFFPKLEEHEMINFKDITEDFFKSLNVEIDYVQSENEAKEEADNLEKGAPYPIYFFDTDTSGEKLYEEFFTARDIVDSDTFQSLGVIKNAIRPDMSDIESTIQKLKKMMDDGKADKAKIVSLLKEFLPDFEHIETGKSLDQKM